jgi:hypothetical protein
MESQRVNRLEPYHWYKVGLGTTRIYVLRAAEPIEQAPFTIQYTDQIRIAWSGERIVAAKGATLQYNWTEKLDNATYGHYPHTPTEEDLHIAVQVVFKD